MNRRIAGTFAIAAVWCGCSLAIDTSGFTSDGVDAGAPVEGGLPEGSAAVVDAATADVAAGEDAAPCTIDVTQDPKNCGRCGRDCLGGTCVNAQCSPVTLVTGESSILGIALDATSIYFARFDGWVRKSKLDGSGVADVRKLNEVGHIELDDTYIYAPGRHNGLVSRFRKDGSGPVEPLAPCTGDCLGIALKDGRVYFTQRAPGGEGDLRIAEADGGATPLLANLLYPEDVFAAPTQLFVANESANEVLGLAYGANKSTLVAAVEDPVAIVADATDMWIVSQKTKTIRRRPIAGGPLTIVANTNGTPVGIAQTATAIYWASEDGTIVRLAK